MAKRSLKLEFKSDVDGALYLIAAPSELDATSWEVIVTRRGRAQREEPTDFVPYYFLEPAGHTAWCVESATGVEVHVPGETEPYVLDLARFHPVRDS
jgi:hypothetical protein